MIMKKYEITKEQILSLNQYGNLFTSNSLKDMFPKAFETTLEVGNWYKSTQFPKWRLHITSVDSKSKRATGYGFGADGLWMENILNESWEFYEFEKCVEMTKKEVLESLKNEAITRGYKNGNHKCLNSCITEQRVEDNYIFDNGNLWYGTNSSANCVFQKGKWAEIIQTISKSEAEKQLGMKIID